METDGMSTMSQGAVAVAGAAYRAVVAYPLDPPAADVDRTAEEGRPCCG